MSYTHYTEITDAGNSQFSHETISADSFLNTKNWTLIEMDKKLRILSNILPSLHGSDVRPIQCDNSMATLNEFLKIIKKLCTSIEKLPLQLSKQTDKYKLSVTLYYLADQTLVLYSLIKMLRPICREDIYKRAEIQMEIQEQFGKILEINRQLI